MNHDMNPTVEEKGQIDSSSDGYRPKKSHHSSAINGDRAEEPVTHKDVSITHDDHVVWDDIEPLESLIQCLQEDFGDIKCRTYELFRNKKTAYDLLWCLFPIGSEVIFKDPSSGVNCGGRVSNFFLCH